MLLIGPPAAVRGEALGEAERRTEVVRRPLFMMCATCQPNAIFRTATTPMRTHKHPRLRGYDYSQVGAYHVIICTHARAHLFGRVVDPAERAQDPYMELNDAGMIVQRCWVEIPRHYPQVALDAFQVMPDHVHGIIVINAVVAPWGDPHRSRSRWVGA